MSQLNILFNFCLLENMPIDLLTPSLSTKKKLWPLLDVQTRVLAQCEDLLTHGLAHCWGSLQRVWKAKGLQCGNTHIPLHGTNYSRWRKE